MTSSKDDETIVLSIIEELVPGAPVIPDQEILRAVQGDVNSIEQSELGANLDIIDILEQIKSWGPFIFAVIREVREQLSKRDSRIPKHEKEVIVAEIVKRLHRTDEEMRQLVKEVVEQLNKE